MSRQSGEISFSIQMEGAARMSQTNVLQKALSLSPALIAIAPARASIALVQELAHFFNR